MDARAAAELAHHVAELGVDERVEQDGRAALGALDREPQVVGRLGARVADLLESWSGNWASSACTSRDAVAPVASETTCSSTVPLRAIPGFSPKPLLTRLLQAPGRLPRVRRSLLVLAVAVAAGSFASTANAARPRLSLPDPLQIGDGLALAVPGHDTDRQPRPRRHAAHGAARSRASTGETVNVLRLEHLPAGRCLPAAVGQLPGEPRPRAGALQGDAPARPPERGADRLRQPARARLLQPDVAADPRARQRPRPDDDVRERRRARVRPPRRQQPEQLAMAGGRLRDEALGVLRPGLQGDGAVAHVPRLGGQPLHAQPRRGVRGVVPRTQRAATSGCPRASGTSSPTSSTRTRPPWRTSRRTSRRHGRT